MEMLFDLGINDDDIKGMLEQCSEILDINENEFNEKIDILTYVGCNERHIRHIIISNPFYLVRSNNDLLKLITYLKRIGFGSINLLFDSNPFLLNKDDFEIENYIDERMKTGMSLDDIVDEIESNPYIIDEI